MLVVFHCENVWSLHGYILKRADTHRLTLLKTHFMKLILQFVSHKMEVRSVDL